MTALAVTLHSIVDYVYLLAAVLFIFGLKELSAVKTARRGNIISSVGMFLAGAATLCLVRDDRLFSLSWIAGCLALGTIIGLLLAFKTPMTGMPQMVGLLNGFGGIASLMVACADYASYYDTTRPFHVMFAIGLTVLVGGVTFTGSMVAFGKLQGLDITPGRPIQFPGQKILIALLLLACLAASVALVYYPRLEWLVMANVAMALTLGVLLVIGIGGADMPVVISLMNSYSGIAAGFAGFVLNNNVLIITGALVGASGIILTHIMCQAMNRSLLNVLFGGVGGAPSPANRTGPGGGDGTDQPTAREMTVEDAAIQLEASQLVVIVPGYGMAVAQAQHAAKDLADQLENRGITVLYAIHPVAGRMPGHMNVLLAEANVPYEQMRDLESINPEFEHTGVALVIGANDVTNPAARHAKESPMYGMPILDVDKARSVIVIKRSLNPGFAGVENELYYKPNCGMLFGDAKSMVNKLVATMKTM